MSRVLVATLLAGCNLVYGIETTDLEPQAPPSRDNDGDGIVNPDDNCVLIANVDQGDVDGDELGDACDPCIDTTTQTGLDADEDGVDDGCDACPEGVNHDEDGDGIGDGCDRCPATAEAMEGDSDGDGIGDACDTDVAVQRRVFFDGFGPPHPAWNTGFKPWQATADGFAPLTPSVGANSYNEGPWNPNAAFTGQRGRVVASVIVPPAELIPQVQRVGLSARLLSSGSPTANCSLEVSGQTWTRVGDSSNAPVSPGRTRFELAFVPSASPGYFTTSCTIAGVTLTSPNLYAIDSYVPSLVANVAAEVEWIDVIE